LVMHAGEARAFGPKEQVLRPLPRPDMPGPVPSPAVSAA